MDKKEIGLRIKSLRNKNSMTQEELAKKIDKTESSIRKYEKGLVEIPLSVLQEIANTFNVNISHLIGINEVAIDQEDPFFALINELDYQITYKNHIVKYDEITDKPLFKTVACIKHKNNNYSIQPSLIELIKRDILSYTDFKMQQLINECNSQKDK